jgi:lysophospholipase L1-like esterase
MASTHADATTPSTVNALSYLALGDSYTIGEAIAARDGWPAQLVERLRQVGIAMDDPDVIAQTGWSTDELDAAITARSPGPHAFVSLLVGVNDQYRGGAADVYRQRFTALLDRAIALANGRADRVIVLAIPDWGVTPFGDASGRDATTIAAELDAFNAAARTVCDARGVAFVDIAPDYREHAREPVMLADDGLHPSAAMHARWADAAFPVALWLLAHG